MPHEPDELFYREALFARNEQQVLGLCTTPGIKTKGKIITSNRAIKNSHFYIFFLFFF
jgi:hypothetical protein